MEWLAGWQRTQLRFRALAGRIGMQALVSGQDRARLVNYGIPSS